MALADQPRIAALALAESWRRLRRNLAGGNRLRIAGPAPERLTLAPPDLNTGDPTVAQEIYSGIYHFAGREVSTGGANPFEMRDMPSAWQHELHSFGWLRHLAASDNALSASHARALLRDWSRLNRTPGKTIAWEVGTASMRLIHWLCHSVLIVDGATLQEYRSFMKSIGQHVRYLRAIAPQAPGGRPRLLAYIALAYADVCLSGKKAGGRQAQQNLGAELERQFLPDGGHVTRNPSVLPEVLALLLPLRQSQARLGAAPVPELVAAIDRMVPAIRFFRMGDGNMAHFNGASTTPHDLIATIMRYDDALGEPPESATFSRYERLRRGEAIVVIDTGPPPRGELSATAHAGCLSFELSDGNSPLIINCGAPPNPDPETAKLARMTAAHSTVTLNNRSSCRFNSPGFMDNYLGSLIFSGPSKVHCSRTEEGGAISVEAGHDGYLRDFGIVHQRTLRLAADGRRLTGMDRFVTNSGKAPTQATRDTAAIRFHLHPGVHVERVQEGVVTLTAGNGARWRFVSADVACHIDDSIFFATPERGRHTQQIVLEAKMSKTNEIRWIFERQ